MNCEKSREYISLHVDGRLDSAGERALNEHLAVCRPCREALAALESAEKAVKAAGATVPRAGYWDTFSGRVMQRIGSEQERRGESRWAKWLPVVLPPEGRRLRFAAGVASIAVGVVAGVLFVSRQGDRVVPTVVQAPVEVENRAEKGENLLSEGQKGSEERAGASVEKKTPAPSPKTEAPSLTAKTKDVSPATKTKEAPPAAKSENAPTGAPTRAAQAPKEATPAAAESEVLDVAATAEPPREEKLAAPAPEKTSQPRATTFATADKRGSVAALERSQPVGGVSLQKIRDSDTSLTVEELRVHIAAWNTRIEASPADSLREDGYREVAAAYCVLAKQTGDKADIEEGARVIRTYLESSRGPATREFLAVKLQELQELRNK
jgi:anti-sigma factor RsiW